MSATATAPASRTVPADEPREDDATPSATIRPVSRRRLRPRHALWALGVLLCVALGTWGVRYWTVGRFVESTDDAYVQRAKAPVSAAINGRVVEIDVVENQHVKAGQVLFKLDPADYIAQVHRSDADLAAARLQASSLADAVTEQRVNLASALQTQSYADREAARRLLDAIPDAKSKGKAKPLFQPSPFQAIERDFAFVVDAKVAAGEIVKAVKLADRNLIEQVTIFDVYEGKGVPEGQKSIAVAVRIQPKDATLTDAEIEALAQKIVAAALKLGATLRS